MNAFNYDTFINLFIHDKYLFTHRTEIDEMKQSFQRYEN